MTKSIIENALWSYAKGSAVISLLIAENILKANYFKKIVESIWHQKQDTSGHNGAI
jgi:hypothetical protein